jgi:hypothetical protein
MKGQRDITPRQMTNPVVISQLQIFGKKVDKTVASLDFSEDLYIVKISN